MEPDREKQIHDVSVEIVNIIAEVYNLQKSWERPKEVIIRELDALRELKHHDMNTRLKLLEFSVNVTYTSLVGGAYTELLLKTEPEKHDASALLKQTRLLKVFANMLFFGDSVRQASAAFAKEIKECKTLERLRCLEQDVNMWTQQVIVSKQAYIDCFSIEK